jgi:hypothetical protein
MNNKIRLTVLAVMISVTSVFAQVTPAPWAEMKNFHHFMSTTFHPAEEGNLNPLKEKADSLLTVAKQWQTSSIPADYKAAETKVALKKLVQLCTKLKVSVAKHVSDEELKKQITAAHDIFHTINKECKKEEEKH